MTLDILNNSSTYNSGQRISIHFIRVEYVEFVKNVKKVTLDIHFVFIYNKNENLICTHLLVSNFVSNMSKMSKMSKKQH